MKRNKNETSLKKVSPFFNLDDFLIRIHSIHVGVQTSFSFETFASQKKLPFAYGSYTLGPGSVKGNLLPNIDRSKGVNNVKCPKTRSCCARSIKCKGVERLE